MQAIVQSVNFTTFLHSNFCRISFPVCQQPLMNDFRESVDQMSEAIKEHRWEEHMSKYGRGISMFRTNEVTELICKGIPNKLRSEIWMLMSGAIHERLANTGTVYILGQ